MYDEQKGMANQRDYERFLEAAHSRPLMRDGNSFRADEFSLSGKRLICIYDYVNLWRHPLLSPSSI